MEKTCEVKVYEVRLYCDECGKEMVFTGRCLASNPPQYPHICIGCGLSKSERKTYPVIVYKPRWMCSKCKDTGVLPSEDDCMISYRCECKKGEAYDEL